LSFYVVLFAVTFGWSDLKAWLRSFGQKAGSVGVGGALVILIVGLFLIWRAAASLPDGRLHVAFLDVGSADAVLIQTPAGKHILINGGESVTILADELGRRLPVFDRRLDWLFVASTEEEQVAALPRVLERYPADAVLWSGNEQASFSSLVLKEYLTTRGVPLQTAAAGDVLDLGDGGTLTVLTAGPRGAVLLIEYKNFRAVLPMGMSFEALDELQDGAAVGPVSLLALADAGYAASNPEAWIVNLNPELVVLSVAAADENGMPDGDVLDSVSDFSLLRTDQNGWVEVVTDGTQMWVNVEKQAVAAP
jgi:competence protein ComEC